MKSYFNSLTYVLNAVEKITYAKVDRKIYVIQYHELWPALNVLDPTRALPPQSQIQLDGLREIKAVLLTD